MIKNFVIYGLLGLCMEVVFTGLASVARRDGRLSCVTSLWMFFIYGLAAFFLPVMDFLSEYPIFARGAVYSVCIFAVEYAAGSALRRFDACPWDYSGAKYSVGGVIRLDFAPLWFCAGLLFEFVYRVFI
ncbi:MAG: putative ABC transporter permease [Clostridiales bacterium]|jgi:uncharacterized membrane protein|nr:putative ABC transporter permease [Clostridiales bacterium]